MNIACTRSLCNPAAGPWYAPVAPGTSVFLFAFRDRVAELRYGCRVLSQCYIEIIDNHESVSTAQFVGVRLAGMAI